MNYNELFEMEEWGEIYEIAQRISLFSDFVDEQRRELNAGGEIDKEEFFNRLDTFYSDVSDLGDIKDVFSGTVDRFSDDEEDDDE